MSKERFSEEQKNTVTARHWDEVLTNNAILNHYSQCKDCLFRNKTTIDGKEFGYDKCICRIYTPQNIIDERGYDYVSAVDGYKPNEVYENIAECEYYEKE